MSPAKRSATATEQLRASLIDHARRLVTRDGAAALTMRGLATEAGCAVGLPYKVFQDRRELVTALVSAELVHLRVMCDELIERAGTATVAANLSWFAAAFLDSPAVALGAELLADQDLRSWVTTTAHDAGISPQAFPDVLARYLAEEKKLGRVAPGVDEAAFGFLLAGSLHNLLVAGEAWPRPAPAALERILTAVADAITR